jgi:hypothetical protein
VDQVGDQTKVIQRNIVARWCKHFCSGKAISITYSERVFVALGTQHAMRVRHIIMPAMLYNIFPHYLINGTILGGEGGSYCT